MNQPHGLAWLMGFGASLLSIIVVTVSLALSGVLGFALWMLYQVLSAGYVVLFPLATP